MPSKIADRELVSRLGKMSLSDLSSLMLEVYRVKSQQVFILDGDGGVKIQVIGASGTGKSTLCDQIHKETGVHWIDADRYLWKDESFSENRPIDERYRLYNDDVARHKDYVVSGSVHSWNPQGFSDRELLVLLVLDEVIRMRRLWDREYARFGNRMLPGGDHYKLTREFLDWCGTYLTADDNAVNSLACHELRLKEASCKTLVLDADRAPETLCETVLRVYYYEGGLLTSGA